MREESLVAVLVPAGRAEGLVAGVLLHGGLGPAAEGAEVGEGRVGVVVSVPQWQGLEGSGSAHDWVPLGGAAVDAQAHAAGFAFVDHGLQEVHVVGGGGGPVLQGRH